MTFTYRWLRCNAAAVGCVDAQTPRAGHEVEAADAYGVLVVEVTATSDQGSTTARSAPTTVVHDADDRSVPPVTSPANTKEPTGLPAGSGRGAPNGDNPSDAARLEAFFSSTGKHSLRIAYGKRPVLRGKLTNPQGAPITNARIELISTLAMRGAHPVDKGGARTRADGTWTLIMPRDLSSRKLTLRYRSHLGDMRPVAEVTLQLSVKAGLTLRITPRQTRNYGTIHFAGRVLGHSIPRHGKLVELQARGKGHSNWITFKTVRSSRGGSVRAKYTFHSSSSVSYQFRSRARAEAGYPYLTGVSRRVSVHVH